ncbi:aminodeoxychorismate synthase component I [Hyphococcus sp. DH-69]|uniref:aminodeoxychorismate synthase component I n=1 Tax=Hyphococcus formosus TaxID=3143534 RepID=UPI00398B328D
MSYMISIEIDWQNPEEAFAPFVGKPHAHLLHSGQSAGDDGWSVIVANPVEIIDTASSESFDRLDNIIRQRRIDRDFGSNNFPFCGGVLGYIGYETAGYFEPSLKLPSHGYPFPDISLGVYDAALAFSQRLGKGFVIGRTRSACEQLHDLLQRQTISSTESQASFALESNFSEDEYLQAVEAVRENILDGDYYQMNLSQRIVGQSQMVVDAYSIAKTALNTANARFGAFMQFNDAAIVSTSPERFFKIDPQSNRITCEPIKGTRPRGETHEEDRGLASSLQSDPKDRAENIMIADLMRNDLSRICDDYSINEDKICELMTLPNVFHLVSKISGKLRTEINFSDILRALFPCGSITGAPKVEAMAAIARMEKVGRGPYCGAIGYYSDCGKADFSVAIRTMMIYGESVSIPVGGGVTLRSEPRSEYQETLDKARNMLASLGQTAKGLR